MTKEEIINRLIDFQIYNENDREDLENSDIESLKDDLLVAFNNELEYKVNFYQGFISRYEKRIAELETKVAVMAGGAIC